MDDDLDGLIAEPLQITDNFKKAKNFLVIDISNLAWRAHTAPNYATLKTSTGVLSGHVFGSMHMLISHINRNLWPGKWQIIYCYDGKKAKARRQLIYPDYKSKRDPNRFNPIGDVTKVLKHLPGLHVRQEQSEGDDAIVWITERLVRAKRNVSIYTGDKDLWTLLRFPNVKIYSPNLKKYVSNEEILKNYLVEDPKKIHLVKCILGDASDDIVGIKRLMKAQLKPLLNMDSVKDVDSFLEAAKICEAIKPNTLKKIEENSEILRLNSKVVYPLTDLFSKENITQVLQKDSNKKEINTLLGNYECKSIINQIELFFGEEKYINIGI